MFVTTRFAASSVVLPALLAVFGVSAQERPLTRAEVDALLAERDAVIIELQNTVNALRDRLEALERSGIAGSPTESDRVEIPVDSVETPPRPSAAVDPPANPARLSVDLDAAERALERTLVQSGALLLPRRSFEFVPTLGYTVSERVSPVLAGTGSALEPAINRVERHSSTLNLTARIGLPADSQIEIGVPYMSVAEKSVLSVGSTASSTSERTGRGRGDWRIGFAKTLMRENGRRPDLVGRIVWGSGEGDVVDDGVSIGGGVEYVDASLSFVRRRDPLALLFSLGYTDTRPRDDIDPGDQYRVSFGTAIAVSPESSLFGSLTYQSSTSFEIAGASVEESDADMTLLGLGLTTILRRGMLLNVFAQLGVSEDAPDYSVGFSVPMRW